MALLPNEHTLVAFWVEDFISKLSLSLMAFFYLLHVLHIINHCCTTSVIILPLKTKSELKGTFLVFTDVTRSLQSVIIHATYRQVSEHCHFYTYRFSIDIQYYLNFLNFSPQAFLTVFYSSVFYRVFTLVLRLAYHWIIVLSFGQFDKINLFSDLHSSYSG